MKKFLIVLVATLILSLAMTACGTTLGTTVNVDVTNVNKIETAAQPAPYAVVEPATQAVAPAQAPAPAVQAPALEPQLTPSGPEVRCWHVNAGKFSLNPGESANGGHVWVSGVEYLFVDDKVVVVTNNSSQAVELNSTDGVGVCNDVDYTRQVALRFLEGCDSNGCEEVKWVNVTESGVVATNIQKP